MRRWARAGLGKFFSAGLCAGVAWFLALAGDLWGGDLRRVIADGHWDVGADIAWDDPGNPQLGGEWIFFLYDFATQQRRNLEDYVFVVDSRYKGRIPAGGSWAQVLGPSGGERWTLPYTQQPEQIYLGLRIFPQPAGVLRGLHAGDPNGRVTVALDGVSGSGRESGGEFAVYEISGLATSPDIHSGMFSTLLPGRNIQLPIGSQAATHTHYFWDMTAPGRYEVTLSLESHLRGSGGVVRGGGRVVFYVTGDSMGPPSGFGQVNMNHFPWIYHGRMGWLYWISLHADAGWFFDAAAGTPYFWLQRDGHLWVYDLAGQGGWTYWH